jgi:hypothetical protein
MYNFINGQILLTSQSKIILLILSAKLTRLQIIKFFEQHLNKNKLENLIIFEAKNGQEGLNFLNNYSQLIKLIFLDLYLPRYGKSKLTGEDVLTHIQLEPQFNKIPLVLVWGSRLPTLLNGFQNNSFKIHLELIYHCDYGLDIDFQNLNQECSEKSLKFGLLRKPFNEQEIYSAIKKAITRKKQEYQVNSPLDKYRQTVIPEAKEHLNTIRSVLSRLALTINDKEELELVYRATFCLRGFFGMLGYPDYIGHSNDIDRCLKILSEKTRNQSIIINEEITQSFLKLVDLMEQSVSLVETNIAPDSQKCNLIRCQSQELINELIIRLV